MTRATERALALAAELGFDLAGVTPLAPPPDGERFAAWLDAGHHGELDYLERQRERILDPSWPAYAAGAAEPSEGPRSLLVVGLAHSRPPFALPDGARVARYAAGRDYHNVMGRLLRKLARRLKAEGLGVGRSVIDAGPLLERSHAAAAGIGFASKAANLLHPDFGPWFFLGELVLDGAAPPPVPDAGALGSCGTCRACIDACPTAAIREPGLVHAPDCISYQTIEQKGAIPLALRARIGDWAFGCDVCSEVCPIGQGAPDLAERFGVHPALDPEGAGSGGLVSWLEVGLEADRAAAEARFDETFAGSPLRRPGRTGLARNAAIVLGNRPSEAGRDVLLRALSFDPADIVREAAGWSLARAHGEDAGVRERLDLARRSEPEAWVRAELDRHLEG